MIQSKAYRINIPNEKGGSNEPPDPSEKKQLIENGGKSKITVRGKHYYKASVYKS